MEVVKTWEKFQKSFKRKGIQNCSPNFEFKYFPNFENSKTEVVMYINLLLQASTYNILASIGQRKQMPHLVIIWKFHKFQKLKNSNKLLLETFSNWAEILTNDSLT